MGSLERATERARSRAKPRPRSLASPSEQLPLSLPGIAILRAPPRAPAWAGPGSTFCGALHQLPGPARLKPARLSSLAAAAIGLLAASEGRTGSACARKEGRKMETAADEQVRGLQFCAQPPWRGWLEAAPALGASRLKRRPRLGLFFSGESRLGL